MIRYILPLLLIASACAGEFSVYLTPPELSENGKALASVGDIHIDVNGKAIPMELVEGRQSIAYPCTAGGNIQFFRVAKDEKQTRTLVASTAVPASAEQGLLVVTPGAEGAYKLAPFWFSGEESKKGSGVFVNLSGRPLGLVCNGQRAKLLPQSRVTVAGRFSAGQTLVPTRVEIFGQTDADSDDLTRLIDRRVGIPQDDTGIYIILPKQQKYITLLSLEGGGLRDPIAKDALKKQLVPQSVSATTPEPIS
jgi:hypothetical protein